MSAQISLFEPMIVDNFAGGGGASTGIEMATGHPVDIAINHDESAILMHQRNHPFTKHYQDDVWIIDPIKVTGGRPVHIAWFSPDCKHFSRAKGAALVSRNIRGLAWVVVKWAGMVHPDIIMLENVPEFTTWGPVRKGKPVKSKSGQTFAKWKAQLEDLGYEIEYKELCAADYGAPTIRKRFVLIARRDGKPIVWPKPTHGPRDSAAVLDGKLKPWRAAAEVIDFTLPTYSIFETKDQIREKYGVKVIRPLADNTQARIATGLDKFVISNDEPFIVPVGYGERKGQTPRTHDIKDPLSTVVSTTKQYVCDPVLSPYHMHNHGNATGTNIREPVNTVTSTGAQMLLETKLSPFGVECNHSGGGHVADLRKPQGTVTAKCTAGRCDAVLSPFVAQQKYNNAAQNAQKPLSTITAVGAHEVVAPCLTQYHGQNHTREVRGQSLTEPIMTVDGSNRYGLLAPVLTQYFGTGKAHMVTDPLNTVTTKDRENLTLCHLTHFKGKDKGQSLYAPLMTVTAADGQFGEVRAVVVKWDGQTDLGYWSQVRELLNKYTDWRIYDDEVLLLWISGAWYFISDIGLRMLTPRELYNAMGFPQDYIIDKDIQGRPISRKDQVARCGNAVCPPMAAAVVRANCPELCPGEINTMEKLHEVMAS